MRLLILLLAAALAQGEIFRFHRATEPNEGAFTILIPDGWKTGGGIVRVNPLTAGGSLASIAAKFDFTIASDDGHTVLRWYPEMNWLDMRGQPAAMMFRQGSNNNGAIVWPKLNAIGYLQQVVLPQSHRGATGVRVKGTYPLPKVAASYQEVVRQMGLPPVFQFDAALIVVEYQEGGTAWEEVLYTAIQDWGAAGAGLWTNKDTFALRSSAGLEKIGRIVSVILNSVRLNPRWVEGEIRGQIERNEIALRTQEEIQRLDREIVNHRSRTNAEINNQMYHNLMRTEEYVNPLTKEVEVGSNEWNYRWVNDKGEAIYTDDTNFDPERLGLKGFVKSPVRKHFPEK